MSSPLFHPEKDLLVCDLCFRHCRIADGATGFCGVNANRNGSIQSLVYGIPEAIHIDPIEKKPLYHFFPGSSIFSIGTAGCNFRCPFCQNWSLSFKSPLHAMPVSNNELISNLKDAGCNSIAFTYNEPTVAWIWYRDLAKLAKESGICTVMVTNGAMSDLVCHEMIGLIDAVNVDLKCGNEKSYTEKLHGDHQRVLENLAILNEGHIWIELTTLVVPDISDSESDLLDSAEIVAEILGETVPWHISAYHPAHHYKEPPTSPLLIERFCESLKMKGFKYVYGGNLDISSDTLCSSCGTTLIERRGYRIHSVLRKGACPSCGRVLEGRFV